MQKIGVLRDMAHPAEMTFTNGMFLFFKRPLASDLTYILVETYGKARKRITGVTSPTHQVCRPSNRYDFDWQHKSFLANVQAFV